MESTSPQVLEQEDPEERLEALRTLVRRNQEYIRDIPFSEDVNNHVHTRYSFSPYSPSSVAYLARTSGLRVVGSVDHDSLGAAEEMKQAASLLDIGSTVGVEVRVSFRLTSFEELRLNNPDTIGNAYIVFHAIPRPSWNRVREWLVPIHKARAERNRKMVDRLNSLMGNSIGRFDYERDILPLSWDSRGGSVTERHILYALALRILQAGGIERGVEALLAKILPAPLEASLRAKILDSTNPHRVYDLLGALKAELLPHIFVQPDLAECPPVQEATRLALSCGAIPAYAYLGDVTVSPTGDKQAQTFEDAYLETLFQVLPELGFQAVTYMPPRNTLAQLKRVQSLATSFGLMEISGVDINSSRQQFSCPIIHQPEFRHLIETTWAMVGHEVLTQENSQSGLFGPASPFAGKPLYHRIEEYARIGRRSVPSGSL